MLQEVTATRYVTPLREGGSLPGLMEADDLGTYVVKFRGAGQGPRALVAEVIAAGIARGLGLSVPELRGVHLDPALAPGEPDQEVQDLLRASAGLNLGVDYLPGSADFGPGVLDVDALLAGRVIWFDAFVGNMDRSHRNPNLLVWHGGLHLIDHGATLSFHHRWSGATDYDARPYDAAEHVLADRPVDIRAADSELAGLLTEELIDEAVAEVPDQWLAADPEFPGADEARQAYVRRLLARRSARPQWVADLANQLESGGSR